MEYFRTNLDSLLKLLMLEPRGHKDMFGAVLTTAADPAATIGAFFLTSRGYLRACVHSPIGLITAGLETGFIFQHARDEGDAIRLEIPAGVVSVMPHYRGDELNSVAIRMQPVFLYSAREPLQLSPAITLMVALAYSGVFFVIADARDLPLPDSSVVPERAKGLAELGVEILTAANRQFKASHPENPSVNSIDLVMFYEDLGNRQARDIVVGPTGSIDRSPCGAGTGAIMTYLYSQGKLQVGEDYVVESFLGTRFTARIVSPAKIESFAGAVPEFEGKAYITGMHQFLVDREDPLTEGLIF